VRFTLKNGMSWDQIATTQHLARGKKHSASGRLASAAIGAIDFIEHHPAARLQPADLEPAACH